MELSGLQIFKYLPAAKKSADANCKECGCPTCMAFALKLAKGNTKIENCKHVPDELKNIYQKSQKLAQKTVEIKGLKTGGENVLFRHEKTFLNPTALCVLLDCAAPDFEKKFERVKNFEICILNKTKKVDLIILKNSQILQQKTNFSPAEIDAEHSNRVIYLEDFQKLPIKIIEDEKFTKTANELKFIREKAIKEKDENYSAPVCVHFSKLTQTGKINELCAKAAFYICKYANMIIFEDFNEAMFSSLMTLRENIFTDPQKPLKVESKIYEFNEPSENSLIFLTTNFALTFFAVANELENLKTSSYLIVIPADGMSVLTAWSAEKFTAKTVVQMLKKTNFSEKVKNRKIIIPGLLAHMKKELDAAIKSAGLDFEIVIGTIDACDIADFVKSRS